MNYTINKTNYKDFGVINTNTVRARSYFVPYNDEQAIRNVDILDLRYKSKLVTCLNGIWDFKYYTKVTECPDILETEAITWDKVTVPSTWQRTGYEPPFYVNTRYQFPVDLPNIPSDISLGIYRRSLEVVDVTKRRIISFLGVISSIDLYINGKHVGYGEGAHNTREWDITNYVTAGNNEIVVVVYKWSNGTYLECQDMFRENGIFRDVLLYELDDVYLLDYHIQSTKIASKKYSCDVSLIIEGEGYNVITELYYKDVPIFNVHDNIHFNKELEVEEWSAEAPNLYTLFIKIYKEDKLISIVKDYIGFKDIQIEGNLFKFNGETIKIKGVNHHDTHPKTGYYLTPSDINKDILLMKEFNVNTVRTSHYPPDPLLLTLADKYGVYVIDEADIECHGLGSCEKSDANLIAEDPKWANHFLDRVGRMFQRDKNHASITMWSLGNESGGIANHDTCYQWLKEVTNIPIHYEGACRSKNRIHYDVVSEMYTWHVVCKLIGQKRWKKKYSDRPFFLCEYAHAMGVGAGGLADYWDIFYKYDNLMGGCIWEMIDHAVYHENGVNKYTYGGDHGEFIHDSNFCVDGLFYPDRTPHTGAYSMRNVYRPIRALSYTKGILTLKNTNYFVDTKNISINVKYLENGTELNNQILNLVLMPKEQLKVKLELPISNTKNDKIINIIYKDKVSNRVIAEESVIVECASKSIVPYNNSQLKPTIVDEKVVFAAKDHNIEARFDQTSGMLLSYKIKNKEIVEKGLTPNLFRVPLDNDMYIDKSWRKAKLDSLEYKTISTKVESNIFKVKYSVLADNKKIAKFSIRYSLNVDGIMEVETTYSNFKFSLPSLPRVATTFRLKEQFDNVRYYGLGDKETLIDFESQSIYGIYSTTVRDMYEPYIKPQESGMRTKVRWLELTNADGIGVRLSYKDKFISFNAKKYSQDKAIDFKHLEDVKEEGFNEINVGGLERGSGSNSCGPSPQKMYQVPSFGIKKFTFYISPIKKCSK